MMQITRNRYRDDFPIFKRMQEHSMPFVYLDNAATSQKPTSVIDCLYDFYTLHNANVHRGIYNQSEESTHRYEQTRTRIKEFINAHYDHEIIFTSGATEGLNLIASCWAMHTLKPGDEILVSQVEHHANLLPWQQVARKTGASLRILTLDEQDLFFKSAEKALHKHTKLVAIAHHSNVLGPVWEHESHLQNFIAAAHTIGAKVILDASQLMLHKRLDVRKLNADVVVFSGHKMLGPTGCGVVYINNNMHGSLQPYKVGGSMVTDVNLAHARWAPMPHLLEAGTPPISSILGLGAAITYLNTVDWQWITNHEAQLTTLLWNTLSSYKEISLVGNNKLICSQGHMVSFKIKDCHPHDVAALLSNDGIAVRAGYLCAQPAVMHLAQGEPLVRISCAFYTSREDIEHFCQALERIIHTIRMGKLGRSCTTKNC